MSHRPSPFRPPARLPGGRPGRTPAARGFSFVELLFAVAVMGIGFIMLAAIFPVGLQQTKLTIDETAAAAGARGSVAAMGQIASALSQYTIPMVTNPPRDQVTEPLPCTYAGALPVAGTLPPALAPGQSRTLMGQVRSFRDRRAFADANPRPVTSGSTAAAPTMTVANTDARRATIWQKVTGELLSKSNDRNGFALLYRRDMVATNVNGVITARAADTAQVIVINAQVAAQAAYTSRDVVDTVAPPTIYNLEPRPVGVVIQPDASGIFTAVFSSAAGSGRTTTTFDGDAAYAAAPGAVAEGTFVVISDDRITAPVRDVGRMNGRIYRVGVSRPDLGLNTFELAPGYEFSRDPGNSGIYGDTATGDDILAIGATVTAPTGYDNTNVTVGGPAIAYVLGRGFSDPGVTPTVAGGYTGPAQDVAIYTTFIPAQ